MTEEERLKIQYFDSLLEHVRELQRCSDVLDNAAVDQGTTEQHWNDFWWALDDLTQEANHYEWLLAVGDQGEHRKVIEALRNRLPMTPSA